MTDPEYLACRAQADFDPLEILQFAPFTPARRRFRRLPADNFFEFSNETPAQQHSDAGSAAGTKADLANVAMNAGYAYYAKKSCVR